MIKITQPHEGVIISPMALHSTIVVQQCKRTTLAPLYWGGPTSAETFATHLNLNDHGIQVLTIDIVKCSNKYQKIICLTLVYLGHQDAKFISKSSRIKIFLDENEKSCIRETLNLSTNADSSTDIFVFAGAKNLVITLKWLKVAHCRCIWQFISILNYRSDEV